MMECMNLPKIELHAHIGGCLRKSSFIRLAKSKNKRIDHLVHKEINLKTAFEVFKVAAVLITDCITL